MCHLDQRETIQFLLEELETPTPLGGSFAGVDRDPFGLPLRVDDQDRQDDGARTPLLLTASSFYRFFGARRQATGTFDEEGQEGDDAPKRAYELERYSLFFGLNALEIAVIAQAKKFLSQKVVQRVTDKIWKGEIVFWDTLNVHSTKRPHFFDKR